jgi:hypothetical protein
MFAHLRTTKLYSAKMPFANPAFFLFYLIILILGIVGCKEKNKEVCINNNCMQTCSSWWGIVAGIVGLFRVVVLSLFIILTKFFYDSSIHNTFLYVVNHLLQTYEKILFYSEFIFILFIGFTSTDTDLWVIYLSCISVEFMFRTYLYISKLVNQSKALFDETYV